MTARHDPVPAIGEARAALAARLREIRIRAGLTAGELAATAGWQRSKISKIEHVKQAPSVSDIHEWCSRCNATDQADDLIASLHAVEGMWIEWRRLWNTGLRKLQDSYVPLWERTRQFRIYESVVIPGLFQTEGYAAGLMRRKKQFRAHRLSLAMPKPQAVIRGRGGTCRGVAVPSRFRTQTGLRERCWT